MAKMNKTKLAELSHEETVKRLAEIYRLRKAAEGAHAAFLKAQKRRDEARAVWIGKQEALDQEIREQEDGPGPLFVDDTRPGGKTGKKK